MRETRILMGMPVTIEIADSSAAEDNFDLVYSYFKYIDDKFSTYKDTSEMAMINSGQLPESDYSEDMKTVLELCAKTKKETSGYFDIFQNGRCDPAGLVKGWAILNAAELLKKEGIKNFYIDAGGDIQTSGKNKDGKTWKIGIRNPFKVKEIIKVVYIDNRGIATSGTYERGEHIYNPREENKPMGEIMSLTVIGPNVYEADRFATAAFAMGRPGIDFIEKLDGFEGYLIDKNGLAFFTQGFEEYTKEHA